MNDTAQIVAVITVLGSGAGVVFAWVRALFADLRTDREKDRTLLLAGLEEVRKEIVRANERTLDVSRELAERDLAKSQIHQNTMEKLADLMKGIAILIRERGVPGPRGRKPGGEPPA